MEAVVGAAKWLKTESTLIEDNHGTTRVDTMQVLQVQFYYAGWVLPVVERRQPNRSSRNGIDRVSSRIRG